MKTNRFVFVTLVTFGAITLRAQTPETGSVSDQSSAYIPPVPPPGPPVSPYGYGSYGPLGAATRWAGAVTIPYAFNWNAIGISAELGGLWMQSHFFGGEISYYDGASQRYNVYSNGTYLGRFNSSQEVTTVDFAYRYFAPLWRPGPWAPVTFYLGASAGVGFVNYSNNGSAFGFKNGGNGNFSGELLAGL